MKCRIVDLEEKIRAIATQKEDLSKHLHDNQDEIYKMQNEIKACLAKRSDSFALSEYVSMVTEAEKHRVEGAHSRVQVRSLRKLVKQLQQDMDRSNRLAWRYSIY